MTTKPPPHVLVYHRTAKPDFDNPIDPAFDEKLQQYRRRVTEARPKGINATQSVIPVSAILPHPHAQLALFGKIYPCKGAEPSPLNVNVNWIMPWRLAP